MDEFENAFNEYMNALERFVKYRISNKHDAEDIIQEVCVTALRKFDTMKDKSVFKWWLIRIAQNKCNDYYRRKPQYADIALDEDRFFDNRGFGEDNCGNEVDLIAKGDIKREGSNVMTVDKTFVLDVVGRYTVMIGGKVYDTVCVMDCFTYNAGVVSEQYLDKNGRTVLWRRFNQNDWAIERYKKPWTEILPDNERLYVNGTTCVHRYDCITDYIL